MHSSHARPPSLPDDDAVENGPYIAPAFTNAAYDVERDHARLPSFLPTERTWLAPLLDAIGSPVFPEAERKSARWVTNWGDDAAAANPPEHSAYLAMAKVFAHGRMPWLIPLLDGARAMVLVSPGSFLFVVDNYPRSIFEIPELVPYTHLVPWVTDEERKAGH